MQSYRLLGVLQQERLTTGRKLPDDVSDIFIGDSRDVNDKISSRDSSLFSNSGPQKASAASVPAMAVLPKKLFLARLRQTTPSPVASQVTSGDRLSSSKHASQSKKKLTDIPRKQQQDLSGVKFRRDSSALETHSINTDGDTLTDVPRSSSSWLEDVVDGLFNRGTDNQKPDLHRRIMLNDMTDGGGGDGGGDGGTYGCLDSCGVCNGGCTPTPPPPPPPTPDPCPEGYDCSGNCGGGAQIDCDGNCITSYGNISIIQI